MIEVFEGLLNDVIEVFYNAAYNEQFIDVNTDLINRCADRADIIYQEQQNNKFLLIEAISRYEDSFSKLPRNKPSPYFCIIRNGEIHVYYNKPNKFMER